MKAKTKRVPGTERRQQILAVATKLFAQQGFNATTTKQIATKARINSFTVTGLIRVPGSNRPG